MVELPAVWWYGGGGGMLIGAAPGSKEGSGAGLLVLCAASLVGVESVAAAVSVNGVESIGGPAVVEAWRLGLGRVLGGCSPLSLLSGLGGACCSCCCMRLPCESPLELYAVTGLTL